MPKRADIEGPIHRSILSYLGLALPDAIVMHSPNEQSMSAFDPKAAAISRGKAKGLGMVSGWPDLQVMLPGGQVFFIEVKAPKGLLSETQKAVHSRLRAAGYAVGVARSIADAQELLAAWGVKTKVQFRGVIS